jgi:hypothetical protein
MKYIKMFENFSINEDVGNFELKKLSKQIYSLLKKEGMDVQMENNNTETDMSGGFDVATQDIYRRGNAAYQEYQKMLKDGGKIRNSKWTDYPIIIAMNHKGGVMSVGFNNSVLLNKILNYKESLNINEELDIDWASIGAHNNDMMKHKSEIENYLNDITSKIISMVPDNMVCELSQPEAWYKIHFSLRDNPNVNDKYKKAMIDSDTIMKTGLDKFTFSMSGH